MYPKMTIEECLAFADEWANGMTLREGVQGWRVVCMLLADEVRRRMEIEAVDAKSKQGWQPIETAPHDKRILVRTDREIYAAHWAQNVETGHEAWIVAEWGEDRDQALVTPDYWMPIPK